MDDTIIHIGFPKAASTTLQKHLFYKHSQINFWGIYPSQANDSNINELDIPSLKDRKVKEFYNYLLHTPNESFDTTYAKQQFSELASTYYNSKKCNLISNERLTGVFFSNPDIYEKADRINTLFPHAKIIIIIRNQIDIIKSQYRDHPFDPQDLTNGEPVSVEKWIDRDLNRKEFSYINSLKYDRIVQYYQQLFGKNKVGVFLFEDFVSNHAFFIKQIAQFLGINEDEAYNSTKEESENTGISKKYNTIRYYKRKYLHKLKIKKYLPPGFINYIEQMLKTGEKQKIHLDSTYSQKLNDIFKESNLFINNHFPVDLSETGYPL